MSMSDPDVLYRTQCEDPELIFDLLKIFCETLPDLQARFHLAVESADTAEIRESAHMMKSRLRQLNWIQLGNDAAEIEELGKSGRAEGVAEKYAALKSGIADAVDELRAYLEGVRQ